MPSEKQRLDQMEHLLYKHRVRQTRIEKKNSEIEGLIGSVPGQLDAVRQLTQKELAEVQAAQATINEEIAKLRAEIKSLRRRS